MGWASPETQHQLAGFYRSVHGMFEDWLAEYPSAHARPTSASGVLSLIDFLHIPWPEQVSRLLEVTVEGRPGSAHSAQ